MIGNAAKSLLSPSPTSFSRRIIQPLYTASTTRSFTSHSSTLTITPPPLFDINPEVYHALSNQLPVVALESTIITHGMPHPTNLQCAQEVESIIRSQGAIPATIALLDGRVKIGLSPAELERLSMVGPQGAMKASRRDLGLAIARKLVGSTTVAGTMVAARRVGIDVFVTGGIGGVHRRGESSMDVSADLTELSKTNVAVVCAGVKSILDIGRTLEYLETMGVPVLSYQTDDFPAFYLPKSGHKSIAKMPNADECAAVIHANQQLGLQNGVVIGVPIPKKDVRVDADVLEKAINEAVEEAEVKGIRGKEITPFLLDRIKTITGGTSLQTTFTSKLSSSTASSFRRTPVFIIGGTVVDITGKFKEHNVLPHTSSMGSVHQSLGGVGRNIAESCFRSGGNPTLISVVGRDAAGESALREMKKIGMDVSGVKTLPSGSSTAVYNAILSKNGDLMYAVADMKIHGEIPFPEEVFVAKKENDDNAPDGIIAVDGNVRTDLMAKIVKSCAASEGRKHLLFEPTSVPKAKALFDILSPQNLNACTPQDIRRAIRYTTPNMDELFCMHQKATEMKLTPPEPTYSFENAKPATFQRYLRELFTEHPNLYESAMSLSHLFETQIIKLGPKGVLVAHRMDIDVLSFSEIDGYPSLAAMYRCVDQVRSDVKGENVLFTYFRPEEVFKSAVSVTGAGDTLVGILLSSLASQCRGMTYWERILRGVRGGIRGAALTLQSPRAVSEKVNPNLLKAS
ncbi:hypothetical protein HDV05_004299 [Chytridiales sp. JEL 0842]|nr:hypothetical protein HDV05_004299 [Chytridiales sp. JEL 0842]